MGASPIIATVVIVFCMMMLGISVGHGSAGARWDGISPMSSTTIIYKGIGLYARAPPEVCLDGDERADTGKISWSSWYDLTPSAIASEKQLLRRADACLYREDRLLPGVWFIVSPLPVFLRFGEETYQCRNPAYRFAGLALRHGGTEHRKVGFSSAFGAFVMAASWQKPLRQRRLSSL